MADDAKEQQLALLVAQVADRITAGGRIDMEALCRSNPDHADELREVLGTMLATQAAGSNALQSPASGQKSAALELPHDLAEFVLESELGRGGMGVVYRATRKSDGEPVAIKMLLKGEFATGTELRRFESEAQASVRLVHPNIVPVYEVGEHQGRAFLCMKLIQGQSLSQRLTSGPMKAREAATLLAKVANAMAYAHEQGVLHRDLKPANILIDETGEPYIADFGLAKQTTDETTLTRSGAIIGTPSYMAPEQAAGRRGEVNFTSDVYSLGAILYHMLTGRPPFQAASPVDTVLLVLEQNPIPPRGLNRLVDRDLEMIAMRCLQKPQDLRYPSASSVANDLTAFLDHRSVSVREGRMGQFFNRLFRETHHAEVLEFWGLIWMWHSLVLLVACVTTNVLYWCGVEDRLIYKLLWTLGFGTWAGVFWFLRRRLGPVTFIERQIAHVWAASLACVFLLFPFEEFLGLKLFELAPVISVVAAMVFLIKAGCLSGSFYIQAVALLLTAIVMAFLPDFGLLIFGVVASASFFFPGLKYHRQRIANTAFRDPPKAE